MRFRLADVTLPDFGLPLGPPPIPGAAYAARCTEALTRAGTDWLVVYADREHNANMAFLSGFEPRFEEALLLLGPGGRRTLVVGNEDESYACVAGLPGLEIALAQSLSLMAQDRTRRPRVMDVVREAGITAGHTVGLVGWKYFEPQEYDDAASGFHAPAWLVGGLARLVGDAAGVHDATAVLMHPADGLRAVIDADQIALHEWGMARASAAVWRIVTGVRPGDTEFAAAARMAYAGEPLTCHVMMTASDASGPVVGLSSPSGRLLRQGDGVSTAVGYWGGLSSRAGLLADHDDAFLPVALAHVRALAEWYDAADIGVPGGTVHERVTGMLARAGLRSALNPGHLTGHDEWIHSPIRPGSGEVIRSGMPFQVDVIPVPMPNGWALNCEDGIVFADDALRADLAARHPPVAARIDARRAFVRSAIGIPLRDSVLPLSNTPLCLPPFWLAAGRLVIAD